MIKELLQEIAAHGERGAVVPISRFDELRHEMEDLRSGDYHIFSDWMAGRMAIPQDLGFEPRSLISVITPSPKVMVEFSHRGRKVPCVVPPQYCDDETKDEEVLAYINAFLAKQGFKAAVLYGVPQKLLAVHSGLGKYGRNNVCFNEEFGSYIRVLSYVSDIPCEEDAWFPAQRMASCENCQACVNACPTRALDPEQRIVNALRCLTCLNESEDPMPDWVDKAVHHCIVGCMRCQDGCPANAHNKYNTVQNPAFTEEETAELLAHKSDEPFSEQLGAKLEAAGFMSFSKVLPRNLALLLESD
jgi:epoxyqueuosine reductase